MGSGLPLDEQQWRLLQRLCTMRLRLSLLVLAAVLAGCGVSPRPPASDAPPPSVPTASPEPPASPESGLGCGDSMISGRLLLYDDGRAAVQYRRADIADVGLPPGYDVAYNPDIDNLTLYDELGQKVADAGDTVLAFGLWMPELQPTFVACGFGRVIAADPGGPYTLPIDACVVWQGLRRDDRRLANHTLVPDADVCHQMRIL
jgi:hypothetical protein